MSQRPAILSPVKRCIGVVDAAPTVAFYQDVLGFEVHSNAGLTEAVRGPARIKFGSHDYEPGDWREPRLRVGHLVL
jgi:hypothetical protein